MRMLSLAPRISRAVVAGALLVALGAVFLGGVVSRVIGVSRIRVLSRACAGTMTATARATVQSHVETEVQKKREFVMFAIRNLIQFCGGLISSSCVEPPLSVRPEREKHHSAFF